MWPFRAKHVVHVDVRRNVDTTAHPEPLVATYRFVGDPRGQRVEYFTKGFFTFSYKVVRRIKRDLPGNMDKNEKRRTKVKVWRDNDTRAIFRSELSVTVPMAVFVFVEVALLVGLAAAGFLIPTESAEPLLPGAAIASLAVNASYFFGNVAMRNTKLAQPFDYSLGKVAVIYGILLCSILLNIAVLYNWPAAWFPDLTELASRVQIALAVSGLIGSVLASGLSAAFEVSKWAIIEESQRRYPIARFVGDLVERRERVHV